MPVNIKAVLFDLDGIVIVGRTRFFSDKLAEEQNIEPEKVQAFFKTDLKPCSMGKADLKEKIAPYLPGWKWHGSVEELLDYWFGSESTKDERVLAVIAALRARGIKCYIASRQERYRMQYLLEEVGLQEHFDGAFPTCEVGFDKSEPEYFKKVLATLRLSPEQVLFFDDREENIEAARALGINAYFYDGFSVLTEHTDPLLK